MHSSDPVYIFANQLIFAGYKPEESYYGTGKPPGTYHDIFP